MRRKREPSLPCTCGAERDNTPHVVTCPALTPPVEVERLRKKTA